MNRIHQRRRRIRSVIGARGAAMVEGIVVMSVMLCFIGLIVWTRKAYGMKLDLQQATRSDSLFYASHGCKGQRPNSTQAGFGGTVPGPTNPGAAVANQAGQAGASQTVSQSWGKASSSANGIAAWAAAFNMNPVGNINYTKVPLISRVSAASQTICNEPKYDNQLIAWAQFAINFVQSGGGGGSLF